MRRSFFKSLVDGMAARPLLFDVLRWVLEAGYRGEKETLKKECPLDSGRVLDLGCGTGALAKVFHPSCYLGVDMNPVYIEWARKSKPSHRFLLMDGRYLEFNAESFDAVVIGGVLHHLEDRHAGKMLAEARRVLKKGTGRLVMWEDVPTRSRWNWMGRLVHSLDEGDHIRLEERYLELVGPYFKDIRHYPMSSGVCDYVVVVGSG